MNSFADPGSAGERPGEIGDADRLDRNVLVAPDGGVNRNDVVLALELQPVAGEVDERHGLRARRRHLVEKLADRPAQRVLVEVARARDVEARGTQALGDQAGIVGGGRLLAGLVLAVADDEREAPFRRLRIDRRRHHGGEHGRQHGQHGRYPVEEWHGSPPLCSAAVSFEADGAQVPFWFCARSSPERQQPSGTMR